MQEMLDFAREVGNPNDIFELKQVERHVVAANTAEMAVLTGQVAHAPLHSST